MSAKQAKKIRKLLKAVINEKLAQGQRISDETEYIEKENNRKIGMVPSGKLGTEDKRAVIADGTVLISTESARGIYRVLKRQIALKRQMAKGKNEYLVTFPVQKHLFATRSLYILMLICSVMLSAIVWTVFQPPSLSYPELPLRIEGPTKTFYPAQTVPLLTKRCSRMTDVMIYQLTRTIVNMETDVSYMYPTNPKIAVPPGCTTTISQAHQLPSTIAPGLYQIRGVGTVKGPFNDIDVPFYSEPFTVIAVPTAIKHDHLE